jgi:transcriptional regulator with XRE-family HTH domain
MTPTEYRALRESIGTREQVALLLGVKPSTIWRRENERRAIPREAELALLYVRVTPRPAP